MRGPPTRISDETKRQWLAAAVQGQRHEQAQCRAQARREEHAVRLPGSAVQEHAPLPQQSQLPSSSSSSSCCICCICCICCSYCISSSSSSSSLLRMGTGAGEQPEAGHGRSHRSVRVE